jgi:2-dehydropantoate 2-reductase
MRISIIGAGSIGLLFASYLLKRDHAVTIYTRGSHQADRLNMHGITLEKIDQKETFPLRAFSFTSFRDTNDADLIIVTVKQHHLETILPILSTAIKANQTIVFIQNGMKHLDSIANLNKGSIYVGVVEHGAIRENETTVKHTGIGCLKVALYRGRQAADFWKGLSSKDFPIFLNGDWHPMLARKLVVNAAINPLTVLFRVRNGDLIANRYLYKTMQMLFEETMLALDISDSERLWQELVKICTNTSNNKSSMLRDIEQNRQTEIDAITGYIIEEGDKQQISLPVSTFIYNSIKGIEAMPRRNNE